MSSQDASLLTPEGREAARQTMLKIPLSDEPETPEQLEYRVHRRLTELQMGLARVLGRIVPAGTPATDLRCPWCGSTVEWNCLEGGGSAHCEEGTMVSIRFVANKPYCFWPGADVQRDLQGEVLVTWDRALGDGHVRPG